MYACVLCEEGRKEGRKGGGSCVTTSILQRRHIQGNEGTYARMQIATVPISVSSAIWLHGVGIHMSICIHHGLVTFAENHIQVPAFPVNAVVCSTALTTHVINIG